MISPVSKTQHNIAQGVSPGYFVCNACIYTERALALGILYAMRDIYTERASALGILYAMRDIFTEMA